jgi:hypothetical protein
MLLLIGAAGPAYAQHDHRGEQQPAQRQQGGHDHQSGQPPQAQPHDQGWRGHQQGPPPQAQQRESGWRGHPQGPPPRGQEPGREGWRGQPPVGRYAPQQRSPQEARAWHQQDGWRRQGGGWGRHENWGEHRAQHWQNEHRSWAQRGGYGGRYIPPDRFERHFGDRHLFRLHGRPEIYQGYPRFRQGGFSFLIVDPWPESWRENWYDTDDVYVGYDDGYYLYSRNDPSVGLALTVVP